MTLTSSQLRLFISVLSYYLKHRGNFIEEVNSLQTNVIYNFNQAGREADSMEKRAVLWSEADREGAWLDERLDQWRHESFYLRKFLQGLKAKSLHERGKNAIAA